jgi:superoxide dismutase, Cu-Zn family
MIRSLGFMTLLALTTVGCNQRAAEVSWAGSATDQVDPHSPVATAAAEHAPQGTVVGGQSHREGDAPQDKVTEQSSTRVVQKPVATHSDASEGQAMHAVCVLQPVGDSGVSGTVTFDRQQDQLHITGSVMGLSPGKHGFHVHQFGDLRDSKEGMSDGGHYNPTGEPHGHREGKMRHVGDFGNIEADASGTANIDFTEPMASIEGAHSIIGHGLVVHAGEDKFTQPSGDAGARVAFGVIGVSNPEQGK